MGTALDTLSAKGQELYEKIASVFGADNVIITSTKRDGGGSSQHDYGDALDFKIRNLTNGQAFQMLANSGLEYKQLINEISGPKSSGPHLHIGAGTGNQNMIYQNGKYSVVEITKGLEDKMRDFDKWVGKKLGVPDSVNDVIHDPNASVAGVVDTLSGGLFSRVTTVVIGVILIGLAIAAFVFLSDKGKDLASTAVKAAA